MLSAVTAAGSRLFRSVVPHHEPAHTATTQATATAPGGQAEERFVADLQNAVVDVNLNRLNELVRAAPLRHLQASVNRAILVGPDYIKPGDTPLHALASRHPVHSRRAARMIDVLLRAGADPNAVNQNGQTPAMRAVDKRQYPQLQGLVSWPTYNPNTPMPRDITENGASDETLLQHVYAIGNYRAQSILEDAGAVGSVSALQAVMRHQNEAGRVNRALVLAEDAPPAYSARLSPPTYHTFMQAEFPPPYPVDIPAGSARVRRSASLDLTRIANAADRPDAEPRTRRFSESDFANAPQTATRYQRSGADLVRWL